MTDLLCLKNSCDNARNKGIPFSSHEKHLQWDRKTRKDGFMLSLTLVACTMLPATVGQTEIEADYVLRGATIVDGSGKDGVVGDLAIKDDRIVAVGKFAWKGNPKVLDCTGLIISPGFIDLHTHS